MQQAVYLWLSGELAPGESKSKPDEGKNGTLESFGVWMKSCCTWGPHKSVTSEVLGYIVLLK